MKDLIINHYTNKQLRKIIHSSGQFTRQLKSVAAYILRSRMKGCNTLGVTGFQVSLENKFTTKVRHPCKTLTTTTQKRKQVLYSKTQTQLHIPSDNLLLSKVAYYKLVYKFKEIDSFIHNKDFIKQLLNNEHFRRNLYQADLDDIDYQFVAQLCKQFNNKLGRKACSKTSLQPISQEKITRVNPESKEDQKNNNVSNCISTLSDKVTGRETIIEPVKNGEIVRKQGAVSNKSSSGQNTLTQSLDYSNTHSVNQYNTRPGNASFQLPDYIEQPSYGEILEQRCREEMEGQFTGVNKFTLCLGFLLGIILYIWFATRHTDARGIVVN